MRSHAFHSASKETNTICFSHFRSLVDVFNLTKIAFIFSGASPFKTETVGKDVTASTEDATGKM